MKRTFQQIQADCAARTKLWQEYVVQKTCSSNSVESAAHLGFSMTEHGAQISFAELC
jgi:hypothetical protein